MIRASPMASHTRCYLFTSNTFLPPTSLTTSYSSPVVFSGGLKSRRGSSVVTKAVPGPNTYIFAFVFPLSLLVATIFTTLRISDKLDEDFLQEVCIFTLVFIALVLLYVFVMQLNGVYQILFLVTVNCRTHMSDLNIDLLLQSPRRNGNCIFVLLICEIRF